MPLFQKNTPLEMTTIPVGEYWDDDKSVRIFKWQLWELFQLCLAIINERSLRTVEGQGLLLQVSGNSLWEGQRSHYFQDGLTFS